MATCHPGLHRQLATPHCTAAEAPVTGGESSWLATEPLVPFQPFTTIDQALWSFSVAQAIPNLAVFLPHTQGQLEGHMFSQLTKGFLIFADQEVYTTYIKDLSGI